MVFALDIDMTISGHRGWFVHARFHNDDLALGISAERLAALTSYQDLLDLPEIRTVRETSPRAWGLSQLRALNTESVIEALEPFPGAAEGVRLLTQYGRVCYVSARPAAVLAASQRWLNASGFPEAEVSCCEGIQQKLILLGQMDARKVMLIDDRGHTSIIQGWQAMQHTSPELAQHLAEKLTIVAYGVHQTQLPIEAPVPLLTLLDWRRKSLMDLLASQALLPLEKKG